MHIKRNHHQDLVDDAAWLQDELERIKGMIPVIPYLDRPLEQESALEMLSKIGNACDSFYKPILKEVVNCNDNIHLSLTVDYDSLYSSEYQKGKDASDVLNHIIQSRGEFLELLKMLKSSDLDRVICMKGEKKTLRKIISGMLLFERGQLKKIAERVRAIDTERAANQK